MRTKDRLYARSAAWAYAGGGGDSAGALPGEPTRLRPRVIASAGYRASLASVGLLLKSQTPFPDLPGDTSPEHLASGVLAGVARARDDLENQPSGRNGPWAPALSAT